MSVLSEGTRATLECSILASLSGKNKLCCAPVCRCLSRQAAEVLGLAAGFSHTTPTAEAIAIPLAWGQGQATLGKVQSCEVPWCLEADFERSVYGGHLIWWTSSLKRVCACDVLVAKSWVLGEHLLELDHQGCRGDPAIMKPGFTLPTCPHLQVGKQDLEGNMTCPRPHSGFVNEQSVLTQYW